MRPPSLRPVTQRKAERAPPDGRFPPKIKSGQKPNRKRMAQVGAYSTRIAPFVRAVQTTSSGNSPASLAGECLEDAARPVRPRPVDKRLRASVARRREGCDRRRVPRGGSARPRAPAPLGGACRWATRRPDSAWRGVPPSRRTSRLPSSPTSSTSSSTFWPRCVLLPRGGFRGVRANGSRSGSEHCSRGRTRSRLPLGCGVRRRSGKSSNASRVDRCADYMQELAPYMHYGRAISEGLPIATGVIEGACRHLVRRRLDIGGARWSTEGAEAIPAPSRPRPLRRPRRVLGVSHEQQVFARTHETQVRGPRAGHPASPPKG